MWRKSGYFGNFVATQFFDFGGKVATFGGKAADFERKILATLFELVLESFFNIFTIILILDGNFTGRFPLEPR